MAKHDKDKKRSRHSESESYSSDDRKDKKRRKESKKDEERERRKEREKDRDSKRDRERKREKERERERDKDRSRDKDRERDSRKEKEKDKSKDKSNEKKDNGAAKEVDNGNALKNRLAKLEEWKKKKLEEQQQQQQQQNTEPNGANGTHEPANNGTNKLSDTDITKTNVTNVTLAINSTVATPTLQASTSSLLNASNVKKKPMGSNVFGGSLDDAAANNSAKLTPSQFTQLQNQQSPQTQKQEDSTDMDEEVDPLDAFMFGIEKEVKDLGLPTEEDYSSKAISFEELQENPTILNELDKSDTTMQDIDEEEYERRFKEEMKNRQVQPLAQIAPEQQVEDNSKVKNQEVLYSDGEYDDADYDSDAQVAVVDEESKKNKNKKDLKAVDHSKVDYEEFRKNFYIPPPELAKLTPEEVAEIRKEMGNIKIRGQNIPAPVKHWHQCGLSDQILQVLNKNKYDKPFAIQSQAIPCIMSGRDVIGIAKTGSGKTLAFILPMLRHILDQRPISEGEGPIGLVIAPTRELAVQIHSDFKKFTKPLGLRCVCAYGGAGVADQIANLKRGASIVVCTPGRMIDLLCANRGKVTNLFRCTMVVLDEADRMFDMGFGPQVTRIVGNIRPDRQTLMFSATFPRAIEALARKVLRNPAEVIVGSARCTPSSNVKQYIEIHSSEDTKFLRLLELLGQFYEKGNAIIFVDRQEEADNLFRELHGAGYGCLSLHGGMEQLDRDFTIQQFKKQEKRVLVATSVAARGLDVKETELVVNYKCPNHIEDYVHRVGRTGRADKEGVAYTFISPEDERYTPDLVKALEKSGSTPSDDVKQMSEAFMEKKKKGLVDSVPKASGFVGKALKGYKFDETEANKKKEERKKQLKQLGLEEEYGEENEGEEAEGGEAPEPRIEIPGTTSATATIVPNPLANITIPTLNPQLPNAEANPFLSIARATAFANQLALQGARTHFSAEVEINDYPQQARYKVTHKDALAELSEQLSVSITPKGTFFGRGGMPLPNERKLYLLVEGNSQEAVDRAKAKIIQMLDEVAIGVSNAPQHQQAPAGRYKVLL